MIKKFKHEGLLIELKSKTAEVEITLGKEKQVIPFKEFWGIAFAMTTKPEMKDKLMPVKQQEIMKFKKVHTVQLKNDMKKDETLTFTCVIDVPLTVIEGFRDMIEKEVEGSREILKEIIPEKLST